MKKNELIVSKIQNRILLIRGHKVIVDRDVAEVYGVTTKALNQAISRNRERFPEDFMFRLSQEEKTQVVTTFDHLETLKYSRVTPNVFTEHGAIMVSSVLNSPKAIEVSVFVVRAFFQLREAISGHQELAGKIYELERSVEKHDDHIVMLFEAINQLMDPQIPPEGRRIGFHVD